MRINQFILKTTKWINSLHIKQKWMRWFDREYTSKKVVGKKNCGRYPTNQNNLWYFFQAKRLIAQNLWTNVVRLSHLNGVVHWERNIYRNGGKKVWKISIGIFESRLLFLSSAYSIRLRLFGPISFSAIIFLVARSYCFHFKTLECGLASPFLQH